MILVSAFVLSVHGETGMELEHVGWRYGGYIPESRGMFLSVGVAPSLSPSEICFPLQYQTPTDT